MKIYLIALLAFYLPIFVSVSCEADDADAADIRELFRAVDKHADPQAFAELKTEAEKGDSLAQEKLGYFYSASDDKPSVNKTKHRRAFRDIIPQDYPEALKWYHKAADQGDVAAMERIGEMYQNGIGVPKNADESIRWFTKAAEKDNTEASHLSWMYYVGANGVRQDYVEAAKGAQVALSQQMDFFTAINLAEMYEHGYGVKQDPVEANYWVRMATLIVKQAPNPENQKVIDDVRALPLTKEQKETVDKRIEAKYGMSHGDFIKVYGDL